MIETKKTIIVSALAMAGVFSTQALADRDRAGFYVTGKVGALVMTQVDQHFRQDSGGDVYKYKGGDKNNTIFGVGLTVGCDLYQHYNVPARMEVKFHGRGAVDSHYTLDTWYSPMGGDGRGDTQNRLSVNTLVVNTYYDFRDSSAFTPWMFVELGYTQVHHKTTCTDTSWNKPGEVDDISALHYSGYDNNFTWSIGASVRYDITPDIALDLNYRYLDADKSSLPYRDVEGDKYKLRADVKSYDIIFGVIYNF